MSLISKRRLRLLGNNLLARLDLTVQRRSRMAELGFLDDPTTSVLHQTKETQDALRSDHPRIAELRQRYEGHPAAAHTQWTSSFVQNEIDLAGFRGDNAYVSQRLGQGVANYALSTQYVNSHDVQDLRNQLSEDGQFGVHSFAIGAQTVSRDLLDSILEINFLDEHLNLLDGRSLTILDIGAGYGRLAQRLTGLASNIDYICTDAVPESTYLCEFYKDYYGLDNVTVVPLDEIQQALEGRKIDLAINIHSFSEMPATAVTWWLDLIRDLKIPRLFIVPNVHDSLTTRESAHDETGGLDVEPLLSARNYKFASREPKYRACPITQEFGVFPAWYWLLEAE